MRLTDKVTIVTGAANGIGTAHAKRFAAEGSKVVVADIDAPRAESVASEIRDRGGTAMAVHLDITDSQAAERVVDAVVEAYGRLDVLVNNAAIYRGKPAVDTSTEHLLTMADVNLWGGWRVSQVVARQLVAQGQGGSIINQSSDAAYVYGIYPTETEMPNFAYGVTKWGVNGLTKFMAASLGPHGIRVNCIVPGLVLSEATLEMLPRERIEAVAQTVPLRSVLEPEDIAAAAIFFASDDSRLITGQILGVNAGAHMMGQ